MAKTVLSLLGSMKEGRSGGREQTLGLVPGFGPSLLTVNGG